MNATFINTLTGGSGFIGRIRTIGDTMFWSLKGSSNIDPTKTFLGSIDNTPLAIRTNNTERLVVTQFGIRLMLFGLIEGIRHLSFQPHRGVPVVAMPRLR
ncbi:MAG: hypothetical protein JWQ98_3400 [Chlorobi bacterium]|nr:hypothetical protein [Chlorobiota bacterium]